MARFFTWHDVEILLEENRMSWPEDWMDVQVYKNEVVIYFDKNRHNPHISDQYLKAMLTKNYDLQKHQILIDFTNSILDVIYEEDEFVQKRGKSYFPLFKDMYFQNGKIANKPDLPARILAFHSYKGGVGRTLSLISFLKECVIKYPKKKILVIDADVEAPGLTWMFEEKNRAEISYLDIFALMNYEKITDEEIKNAAELMKSSTITITTEVAEVEQYFLPVYRDKKQVLEIVSDPEKILFAQENEFYITETIARLGEVLGAELILVDLRAGITEFSAPYLFDARVEKYFVTSTSMQSVKGINQIMEQVYEKTETDLLKSKVLMTMIPRVMSESDKLLIEDQILKRIEEKFDSMDDTFLRESYIVRINFDESLIHIGDFNILCNTLQGTPISKKMALLVEGFFIGENDLEVQYQETEVRQVLKKIHDIAKSEITAEGNNSTNLLVTSSIKELVKNFRFEVPKIVVPGAKGSGKTYVYKQLLSAKSWDNFERITGVVDSREGKNTLILPLIASLNIKEVKQLLDENIAFLNSKLNDFQMKSSIVNNNFLLIKDYSEQQKPLTQSEWTKVWGEVMLEFFANRFSGLNELDEYLEKNHKKIIYIVDGLEDLFMDAQNEGREGWRFAIRGLCQYVINVLDNLDYGNIGIIVFARKDMLDDAIETNNEQFQNQYYKYELNWSQTEALRLALWLAAKAYSKLAEDIHIPTASMDVLVDRLSQLWGVKLGKADSREAYCDRWILAALSDFSGQLQARDIVRFLKYSTKSYADVKLLYQDRFIMPTEIRKAIEPCSVDKLAEMRTEMKAIYAILEKFKKMQPELKQLPMTLSEISLTGEEIAKLEAQGYLKIADKKYYLPEIIRLSLGFKYEKGARPKVLSFLVK